MTDGTREPAARTAAQANGAAGLFRTVGLMADGPVVWGRPVPARGPGVYVVELPAPLLHAPLDINRIGKWLEHVPELRLDTVHPTARGLAARLGAFWLPSSRVLFIGATEGSIGGRIEAIRNTLLGDRRPHAGGHWLHTLSGLDTARVWWAQTRAVEEAEDALLGAFAATIPAAERAALHDSEIVLPFANLRTVTGERKTTGLANSLVAAEPKQVVPAGRIVELAAGAADGAAESTRGRAAGGTIRRAPRTATAGAPTRPRPARSTPATPRPSGRRPGDRPATETTWVSADGIARLQAEHAELTGTKRPEVIARIKSAKELGDLKENADYTSAREEQSFLEGRIKAIEATLRAATVIEAPSGDAAARVSLGSTVTVEDETGATMTFVVVGSAEADPGAGRISNVSPVGKALMGRSVDDDVAVAAPRGEVRYRIVDLA
ncbi:MAG TPA: transcription elongation factor GreA [Patescibacteria group bacterium]|nr:transcription elongation factor GreA [Patescibacteria group bacterium]